MLYRKKRGSLKPHNSSIILNLKPILALRNIPHPSAFLIKIGINTTAVNKMLKGEAVQLNFRQLTILCTHLNCTPNDLFETRDMTLPPGHSLEVLAPKPEVMSLTDFARSKTVAQMNELLTRAENS